MNIEYSKKAVKYINTLDKPTKQRIKAGIIYHYNHNGEIEVLYIMSVDTRGDIYK